MESKSQRQNPYVGPRPFAPFEHDLFFGRDREINDLVNLVFAYGIVLLNAQSGAGKSSLLNAGIIPRLTQEGHRILRTRIRDPLPEPLEVEDKTNFFVFKTLVSWSETSPNPQQFAQMTFSQYLKAFAPPVEQDGEPLLTVLIFDQFEDLFTFHPRHWRDRRGFFEQLGKAVYKDPQLRVLFAIREEYVSRLGTYADLLPDNLRVRYYLEHLRHDAAVKAITRPLKVKDPVRSFADKAADELATNLAKIRVEAHPGEDDLIAGEFVEPVQLQIVCQNLWEQLPSDLTVIQSEQIAVLGDVNEALEDFYQRNIKTTAEDMKISEGRLRDWFEDNLITSEGTPGLVHRGTEKTAGLPNSVVAMLDDLRLIRQELRAGVTWYELAHDRFVTPILHSNQLWREARAQRRGRRILVASLLGVVLIALAVLVVQSNSSQFSTFVQLGFADARSNWIATRAGLGGISPDQVTQTPIDTFLLTATAQAQQWAEQPMIQKGVEMVLVPPGCTWIGNQVAANDQRPLFQWCSDTGYWIDRYEVTDREFQESGIVTTKLLPEGADPEMPRTYVTFQEALAYCQWRDPNGTLPTEVQWEYAARGPNSLRYPWGNNFVPYNAVYNVVPPSLDQPPSPNIVGVIQPNGQLKPSREEGHSWVGAYDMSGNVAEWTTTIYEGYSYPYAADGRENLNASAQVRRVVRGGSFLSPDSIYVTTAYRKDAKSDQPLTSVGFRCIIPSA